MTLFFLFLPAVNSGEVRKRAFMRLCEGRTPRVCTLFGMKIAVYIRVSSHSQKTDSQRADIRRWLIAHGHDPDTVQLFEDKETGATLQRPGLLALKEAIFAGTVKTV